MWSSIEQVIKPESLAEAAALVQEKDFALFAGGSYLVAEKDPSINTLIDINHLVENSVERHAGELHIQAGCTLQEIVDLHTESLSDAALASCPSKNIRNQRTLGGEIARARTTSDLLVYLYTVDAKLTLNGTNTPVELTEWNAQGIITGVIIPENRVKLERVALLDSAPAIVILGYNESPDTIRVCVGGQLTELVYYKTKPEPVEQEVRDFLDKVENAFSDDHHGSATYKRKLVCKLLQELAGAK